LAGGLCRRYLIENCTGTLKLIAACFISGLGGVGCAFCSGGASTSGLCSGGVGAICS
jgi:hypothetical protein